MCFLKRVLPFLLLLSSCKLLPHHIRSGSTQSEVGVLLDKGSIKFERAADGASGTLRFTLKDKHNCRVEYWSDDPTGTPPPSSSLSVDCPKDKQSLDQTLSIPALTAGYPLTLRIFVWPKSISLGTQFSEMYREGQDQVGSKSQDLVVVRYAGPRNSAEIYGYRMAKPLSVKDIQSRIKPALGCVENPSSPASVFARSNSIEDSKRRPLFGLSQVTTEGFGSGAAVVHPFYPTRLTEFFEQTARQENWRFRFFWEKRAYDFESSPPGYIGSVAIGDGLESVNVKSRSLAGALDSIVLNANSLQIAPKVIFASDISNFEVTVKSQDASSVLLTCRFPVGNDKLEVPSELIAKLPKGNYLATFSFETSQVHYRDQSPYPPWVITAQDWVQFRLNKRL